MTLPRSAADVLSGHVVFEYESIDRMYLLSGLAEGSSQFTGRARDEVETFPAVTEYQDLAALAGPPLVGSLEPTGDAWEPWRLCDPSALVVAPVAAVPSGPAGRWPAGDHAADVCDRVAALVPVLVGGRGGVGSGDRAEARDFCRWIQVSTKPGAGPGGGGGARARVRNPVTGKAVPGRWYVPATAAHSESVLRGFYDFHQDAGTGRWSTRSAGPCPAGREGRGASQSG